MRNPNDRPIPSEQTQANVHLAEHKIQLDSIGMVAEEREEEMSDKLRRTGRTTRMLNDAIAAVKEGKKVVVVAADYDHCKTLDQTAKTKGIRYISISSPYFDRKSMTIRGVKDAVYFVDHYAIETRLK